MLMPSIFGEDMFDDFMRDFRFLMTEMRRGREKALRAQRQKSYEN